MSALFDLAVVCVAHSMAFAMILTAWIAISGRPLWRK